jgi:hypothetical protein
MFSINSLKQNIEKNNKYAIPRLKIFLSDYEKARSKIFSNILTDFDFIKNQNVTFVASGLPFYMFDVLNTRYVSDLNMLNASKKSVKKDNELIEITFINNLSSETQKHSSITNKIKLIDYSPLVKSSYSFVSKYFENIDFEFYNRNVNFEDIRDITNDSLVIIPYSEYLYILNELNIFNKDQYVIVFNQKEDEERRKVNTAFCVQDLVEQCNFSEVILAEKYNVCGTNVYVVLGKV